MINYKIDDRLEHPKLKITEDELKALARSVIHSKTLCNSAVIITACDEQWKLWNHSALLDRFFFYRAYSVHQLLRSGQFKVFARLEVPISTPGCRMVRPDGGTCFWRSTSLTVVWGPHHDALTPPQPCVCRDVTVFSSKIHCYAYGTNPHRRVVSHITCVWDRGATAGRPIGKLLGVRARSTSLIVLWGHRLLAPGTIQPWDHYG